MERAIDYFDSYFDEEENIAKYFLHKTNKDEENIVRDVARSFHFLSHLNEIEQFSLRSILKHILIRCNVPYYQGMHELASVIVFVYFKDDVKKLQTKLVQNNYNSFVKILTNNNEEKIRKCTVIICKLLSEKALPLLTKDFEVYTKLNDLFIETMKIRGTKIDKQISFKYMNNTITWFINYIDSVDDILTLYIFIAEAQQNIIFLLLILFLEDLNKKKKLKIDMASIKKEIIPIEKDWKTAEQKLKKNSSNSIGRKTLGFIGVGLAVAVGVGILLKGDKKQRK